MARDTELKKEYKFTDFSKVAIHKYHPKWKTAVSRLDEIYKKDYDPRTPFERDGQRILHSNAYRRLKHKTQVFFATHNDHVCTRIEHVTHVSSIAGTIGKILNLNLELVQAIATGHDLGHAPFGHQGEYILRDLVKKYSLEKDFWHEGNSLHFIDEIETLPDYEGFQKNLNLTYAVRDGIVCHCGEVDEQRLKPRNEPVDLKLIKKAGAVQAYTYEGCVVKVSDKIAYIGRDIEDALTYGVLAENQVLELKHIVQLPDISATVLMHKFIIDLCQNSSPEEGLCFSTDCFKIMKLLKEFNYKNIYFHPRLDAFKKYAKLVLEAIFEKLDSYYCDDIEHILEKEKKFYPELIYHFRDWLIKYSNFNLYAKEQAKCKNKMVYDTKVQNAYRLAIVDFISGMSDQFAIKMFNEIISF